MFRICLSCFAGRSRLAGLCTAPLAAEVLAAQIFGEALPLDDETLAAIHPARFYVRKLLKGRPLPKNPDPLLTGHRAGLHHIIDIFPPVKRNFISRLY